MISVKDRRLLQDALDWRCDAFMAMERRLPTAAAFIERETGLPARPGMKVLLHWLGEAARAYQGEARRVSSADGRLLPQVVVWAHGCREELTAASEALNVELSTGIDR